jgi:hypothetical protein
MAISLMEDSCMTSINVYWQGAQLENRWLQSKKSIGMHPVGRQQLKGDDPIPAPVTNMTKKSSPKFGSAESLVCSCGGMSAAGELI